MTIEAMRQALEALELEAAGWDSVSPVTRDAIIALLAAIEEAEKPWVKTYSGGQPQYTTPLKGTEMNERPMTFGEKAVGLTFNPSGDATVEAIKRKCADLIDEIHALRTNQPNGEIARMASVAITEIQSGQMWAVKAATWKY